MAKEYKVRIPYQVTAKFGYNPVGDNGDSEVIYHCPYCPEVKGTPDTKGKLYVNVKSLKYHCFRCGTSGVLSDKNVDYKRVYQAEIAEANNDKFIESVSTLLEVEKYPLKIPIEKVTENEVATEYLLKRGFTYEQMKYYDLRAGNLNQEFGRIIIPNQVYKEVYVDTYSARTFTGQTPKYHNPRGINKKFVVFNLHRIKSYDTIILVEGALTAIAAGYHAVASLGKTLSPEQASQIAQKKPKCIYVNYDYGAEKESHAACDLLYSLVPDTPIYEVLMPDDRDAADLSKEEYAERLSKARRYLPLFNDLLEVL